MDNEKVETNENSILKLIGTIIISAVFLPIIIINTVLIGKSLITPNQLPSVFGISPVVVLSGSMSPIFDENDLIIIKKVDPNTLEQYDIICFKDDDSYTTHRILRFEINSETNEKEIVTGGDYLGTEDFDRVSFEDVQGVYVTRIKGAGKIVMFMQSTVGVILIVVLPAFLYFMLELLASKKESSNKTKQLELELQKLLAEKESKENKEE